MILHIMSQCHDICNASYAWPPLHLCRPVLAESNRIIIYRYNLGNMYMFLFVWAYNCCHLIKSNYRKGLMTTCCLFYKHYRYTHNYVVAGQSLHVHHVPVAGLMDNKLPNRKCWITGHLPSTCRTKCI